MKVGLLFGGGLLLVIQPVVAADLACMGKPEIAGARIVRVEDNGVLVLADGRAIKLEGIRLTNEGHAALRQLTAGRVFDFFATAPRQDRYGRVRAHATFDSHEWLQEVLLKRGLARVEMAPDRAECASELYTAEKQARTDRIGLWALPVNAVRGTFLARTDTGTFQIVQGRVLGAEIRNGRAYLNFGADYKTDFTVTISQEDRKLFRAAKVDPRDYAGKVIRVRGIVQYFNGPQLEVAAPHQIEIIQ